MKFLIDEDVPVRLIKFLAEFGHDALRVKSSAADITIAQQAKDEKRILITLDKDFANTLLFPPKEFNIILIRIHPPYENSILEAVQSLLTKLPSKEFRGLIILSKEGHFRIH